MKECNNEAVPFGINSKMQETNKSTANHVTHHPDIDPPYAGRLCFSPMLAKRKSSLIYNKELPNQR